ncbi:hypothetical protein ABZS66_58770 [Dactylosporangium sp. NPDC005572]|uniref:SMI1/KNR4 family protein n=1 Tax=Dactylosporangium sp. NPDC005572 TaxID=3156889 RepID=UPI00339FEF7E
MDDPPEAEAEVAAFEAAHGVRLPEPYRRFVIETGDPGLVPLAHACPGRCAPGHLTRPSPYVPGPRYIGDWEVRYEAPGRDRVFLPGTLIVAGHGCSLYTHLVVSGPARGRLFNLDNEGPWGPYVVEDPDFLAWYERWRDDRDSGLQRLPLGAAELLDVLAADPAPHRRALAGTSLLALPVVSGEAWTALARAVARDPDPSVRADLWQALDRTRAQRPPAEEVARYARECDPPDLRALATLRRLTYADVAPELVSDDLERRRTAAYLLAWEGPDAPPADVEAAVSWLLADSDRIVRAHAVAAVRRHRLTRLRPVVRSLLHRDTDPWTLDYARWCLEVPQPLRGPWDGEPPF